MKCCGALARLVRAGNPRPGAWCTVGGRGEGLGAVVPMHAVVDGADVRGLTKHRGALVVADGVLELLEVQPEGKRTMTERPSSRPRRDSRSARSKP